MSLLLLKTHNNQTIPVGSLIVIDTVSLRPRVYNPLSDSLDNVVGVSYSKTQTLGRLADAPDGIVFLQNDYFKVNLNTLQYERDENQYLIVNEAFDPELNPLNDTTYVALATKGLVSVLKGTVVPARFKKLRENTAQGDTHDLFLLV
jgi:hypothetical protein